MKHFKREERQQCIINARVYQLLDQCRKKSGISTDLLIEKGNLKETKGLNFKSRFSELRGKAGLILARRWEEADNIDRSITAWKLLDFYMAMGKMVGRRKMAELTWQMVDKEKNTNIKLALISLLLNEKQKAALVKEAEKKYRPKRSHSKSKK